MAYQSKKHRKFVATSVTAAVVAAAVAPAAGFAAEFKDSIPAWAKDAVNYLADKGALEGRPDGTFDQAAPITRAEAAKILALTLGLTVDDAAKTDFADAKDHWASKYIAAIQDQLPGVINGYNGKFNPNNKITRQEMAKMVVEAYGLEAGAGEADFSDNNGWGAEYVEVLASLGIVEGVSEGKFAPNASVTRGQAAVFVYRTEVPSERIGVGVDGVESVKAINNTTVEVDYASDVDNVNALNFAIDGLTVTNAAVKQTDSSVVVLTTSAQEVGKTYTVTESGAVVGSFVGAETVIPTGIETTVGSYQGVLGKEVTLKAQVTVADGKSKAGIPVTFNIVDENDNDKNDKVEVEVFTNADGVAEYSYTRYYEGVDEVVAYATDKSSVSDDAKVYWDDAVQLSVEADEEDLTLANGDSVSYKIKGDDNAIVYVALKENLNVEIDEVIEDVYLTDVDGKSTYVYDKDEDELQNLANLDVEELYPYDVDSKDYRLVIIELDDDGEGSFTLSGEDAKVTPIVYTFDQDDEDLEKIVDDKKYGDFERYDRTALQAVGETVTFEKDDDLQIQVEAQANKNAAGFDKDVWTADLKDGYVIPKYDFDNQPANLGGRDYVATIKDEDGDTVGKGFEVTVFVDEDHIKEDVYLVDVNGKVWDMSDEKPAVLEANKDGKVKFTLVGESTGYATPTVFIDDNENGELNSKDVRTEGERVYFKAPSIKNAGLKTYDHPDGDEISTVSVEQLARFSYISVDQNGKRYFDEEEDFVVTFSVKADKTDVVVTDFDGKVLASIKAGKTETIKVDSAGAFDGEGVASIFVEAETKGSVVVKASSTSPSLGTVSKTLKVVGASDIGDTFSGDVEAINTTRHTITFAGGKDPVKYDISDDDFYNDITEESIKGAKFEDLVKAALDEGSTVKVKYEKGEEGETWTILSIQSQTPGTPGTPGTITSAVVDAVNAANTNAQIETAVQSLALYKALTASEKTTVIGNIASGLGTAAYTSTSLEAEFTALLTGDITISAADFTASQAGVTPLAATTSDTITVAGSNYTFGITAKEVGTDYNGYTVDVVNSDATNRTLTATLSGKSLTIDLANDSAGNVTSSIQDVIDAIESKIKFTVSVEPVVSTDSALDTTRFATDLVGLSLDTATSGRDAAALVPAELELTFTESVNVSVGDEVVLEIDGDVVTGTVATVADEVLTLTLDATNEALVPVATVSVKVTDGVTSFSGNDFDFTAPVAIN